MTEPKKVAVVFLAVLAIGCLALATEWLRERVNGWLALLAASVILLLMALYIHPAGAQEHRHPPEHAQLHERFYKTWNMPDNRAVSCCHDQDCKPAEAKMIEGRWYARQVGDTGEFTPIPQSKIEQDRDSPDGRSHLCGRRYFWKGEFTVFCFIFGNGG